MAPKVGIRRIDIHEIDSVFYGEIEIGFDLFGGFMHPLCFSAVYGKKINAIERVPVIRRGICSFAFNITSRQSCVSTHYFLTTRTGKWYKGSRIVSLEICPSYGTVVMRKRLDTI